MNKPNLSWHCKTCNQPREFKYISSNAETASLPEQHFYSCVSNCGRTYEQRQMLTLENTIKLYGNIVTTK